MNLAGGAVDDLGRRADEDAHRQHRAVLDDDALDDLAARADEAIVLDDDRLGLQRLEHAADADAAREVAVLADLRAGADRRPGIDHGAAADIGADIDEARHQHDVGRDIGRAAHDAARHGAEAGVAEALRRPSRRISTAPCPTTAAPPGPPRDLAHVVEAERQQHRLLQPLMDLPARRRSSRRRASLPLSSRRAPPRRRRAPRPWSRS